MIAKLITYAPTRSLSSIAMAKALSKYRVVGLPTNLKFLKNVFDNQIFDKGDYDTSFIEKNINDLIPLTKTVDPYDLVSALAIKTSISSSNLNIPK
jgi:acetyl/propionyl-CoA carboxylase alpha subunit